MALVVADASVRPLGTVQSLEAIVAPCNFPSSLALPSFVESREHQTT